MVDTLAFLKNDYSEEEIHKIIDEINAYVTFFGGYGATLLKTTSATIYREKKEGFEAPEEVIIGKLSADMLAIQHKLDGLKYASSDERLDFMSTREFSELMKARGIIANNYIAEHDGFNVTEYEPNKYVINARLNLGAYRDLARLLENMGIEFTDIVQWWGDEFDKNTAFDFLEYKPKKIEMTKYDFWLADAYTKKELKNMMHTLTKSLEQTRYGLYYVHDYNIMIATTDTVVKIPVVDEYKKYMEYENSVYSNLINEAMSSGKPDENKWREIEDVVKKETEEYCKTHHVFDERLMNKGQIVLSLTILDEDVNNAKNVIEGAGYSLLFHSINNSKSMAQSSFTHI